MLYKIICFLIDHFQRYYKQDLVRKINKKYIGDWELDGHEWEMWEDKDGNITIRTHNKLGYKYHKLYKWRKKKEYGQI